MNIIHIGLPLVHNGQAADRLVFREVIAIPNNFDGIKTRKFGVEVELTGITRCQAAQAMNSVLKGDIEHYGSAYYIRDEQYRRWSVVYDGSITPYNRGGGLDNEYKVEINTPILEYDDIPLLQEVIRALRKAGGVSGARYMAGTHIHIDGDGYTPQKLRNLVNIFSSKEDYLWEALQVSSMREGYCGKIDRNFVEAVNRRKPKTMEEFSRLWYTNGGTLSHSLGHSSRYKALNLHSFFEDGHFEVRCANGSLHAGVLRAELCLILAISNAAMTKKYCSPAVSYSDNMRYSFRVWLLNLGMIGDEFKNCRMHLLKHLDGNIAWRHPEDALAQRERLRAEREATRNARVRPVSSETDEVGVMTPPEEESPAVSDFDGVSDEDFLAEETNGLLYPT